MRVGIRLSRRQFAPSLLFTLLYLLVGATMVGLGYWQLQRANEKIVMQRSADEAAQRDPIAIGQLELDNNTPAVEYARVVLDGRFEPKHQFLWDNRIAAGRAGFEVITPFRVTPGRQLVLVNRGWVPLGPSRQQLPDLTLGVDSEIRFTGVFTRPSIGFSGGDAVNLLSTEWPKLLQHFEFAQIARVLGEPVLAGLVQVERNAAGGVEGANLDGIQFYPDNWQPVASGPERHYGYAFQWFAMFVALSALYFILNTKKIVTSKSS